MTADLLVLLTAAVFAVALLYSSAGLAGLAGRRLAHTAITRLASAVLLIAGIELILFP